MSATSQRQRAYLNWRFGHAWVKKHHFDNPGKLPRTAPRRKGKRPTRRDIRRQRMIEQFARRNRRGR